MVDSGLDCLLRSFIGCGRFSLSASFRSLSISLGGSLCGEFEEWYADICDCDFLECVPVISGSADYRALYIAVVWRESGGVDHVYAVFSGGAFSRLQLCASVGVAFPTSTGLAGGDSCGLDRAVDRSSPDHPN